MRKLLKLLENRQNSMKNILIVCSKNWLLDNMKLKNLLKKKMLKL